MKVAVLALQGAVREHLDALRRCGVSALAARHPKEIEDSDALIIPGGESTTIGKLMARYGLLEPIKEMAASGKPILGTCAGMILMAKDIRAAAQDQPALGIMDIAVERNAFGRQINSFEADLDFKGIDGGPVRAVFICAPIMISGGPGVETLARHEGRMVAARQGNLLALSFHPELTSDLRLHKYFLDMCK